MPKRMNYLTFAYKLEEWEAQTLGSTASTGDPWSVTKVVSECFIYFHRTQEDQDGRQFEFSGIAVLEALQKLNSLGFIWDDEEDEWVQKGSGEKVT